MRRLALRWASCRSAESKGLDPENTRLTHGLIWIKTCVNKQNQSPVFGTPESEDTIFTLCWPTGCVTHSKRIELQVALLTELLPSKARASKGSSRHEGNGSGMVQLQVPEGPASGNQEIRSADLEPDILSSVALARCLCFLGGNGGRLCDTGRLRGGPVTTLEAEVCRGNRGHC